MTTKITWTEETWNPQTGCDRVSDGCGIGPGANCYALDLAKRLKAMHHPRYQTDGDPRTSGPGFAYTEHWDVLNKPLHWKPSRIFVNSMSDMFHPSATDAFLLAVLDTMAKTAWHTYQVLTKRPTRMARFLTEHRPTPLPNVWFGTSIELDKYHWRADHLRATPAAIRFISAEPLLGPLPSLDLTDIEWLIIGGQSGHRALPMDLDWAYDLVERCHDQGVAVFVKQLGSRWGKTHHDIDTFPAELQVRDYPPSPAV